jgi:WD40 repeat protein
MSLTLCDPSIQRREFVAMSPSFGWLNLILAICLFTPLANGQPAQRRDANGDPLPAEAIARLGSLRWRVGGWVHGLDFSPDGTKLVTGSVDNTVRVWDVASGRETMRLGGHGAWVIGVAYSPDGKLIASAGADKIIRLWDSDGKLVRELLGHENGVGHVAFSPQGHLLASCDNFVSGGDSALRLWDPKTGKLLHTIKHIDRVLRVAFDGTGKLVAGACEDGIIRIFDTDTAAEKVQFKFLNAGRGVSHLAFASNGKLLAAATNQIMIVWDVETRKELKRVKDHLPYAFSPTSQFLATEIREGPIRLRSSIVIWDTSEWQEKKRFSVPHVTSVTFSRNSKTLAAGTACSVHLWEFESGKELNPVDDHRASVTCVAFAPDGKSLVTGGWDGSVRIWDAFSGKHLRKLGGDRGAVGIVAFTGEGRQLVHAGDDVRVCEVSSSKELSKHSLPENASATGFLRDGNAVTVEGTRRGVIEIRDIATFKVTSTVPAEYRFVHTVSGDGTTILLGSGDESNPTLQIWNVKSKKAVREIRLDGRGQYSLDRRHVALSHDGAMAALTTDRRVIVLWDLAKGEELRRLPAVEHEVFCLAFSPDGKLLAEANWDKKIRVYDVKTGKILHQFRGHEGQIGAFAFSPDGNILASASYDGTALLWSLDDRKSQK